MINPKSIHTQIENFILIKYTKHRLDKPKHVEFKTSIHKWQDDQELMFRTMVEQLNYFYPKAIIHVLTNERHKDAKKLIWHYEPELEENHNAKLLLYGLLDVPAMYIDTDILIGYPFRRRHLSTTSPFNLYQYSWTSRQLQILCRNPLEFNTDKQYNCGMIWIPRPSQQIVTELQCIKKEHFSDRHWIESHGAWFNNDEHPVSYFITKYGMKMNIFNEVNVFRSRCKYDDIFQMQSIHYTGVRHKERFIQEYKELCKSRVRIFT